MHSISQPLPSSALLLALLLAGCSDRALTTAAAPHDAPQFSGTDAGSPNLVISQVYGGGGNSGAPYTHDYVEIFNRGSTATSLNGLSIQYASATGTGNFGANSALLTELPNVTISPGKYFLVQQASQAAVGSPLPTPDLVDSTPIAMAAGAGKVAIVTGTSTLGCNAGSTPCNAEQLARIIDLVGYGNANFYEGSGAAPTLSNSVAGFRRDGGCTDTDNNAGDFVAGAPAPRNMTSPLHVCVPSVASTSPMSSEANVAVDADITITFSRAVTVTGEWFSVSCTTSGIHPATVSGGPTTFILDPDSDFADDQTCTVTIVAGQITDQAVPTNNMAADYSWSFSTVTVNVCEAAFTPIYNIQGSGLTAATTGTVTTQGVVIGDYEGPAPTLRGFYIQDPTGDGDSATSDGIFVFNGNNDDVGLGDVVRVSGTAEEFQGQTQIGSVTSVIKCGTGSITPVDLTLPFPDADYPERFEGMLVRLPQMLYVTEHFQLGRFGQVVMSSGGRLQQPTNVVAPGGPALAMQAANNLNRIIVDDALNNQNPDPILFGRGSNPLSASNTLRGGDEATGIVGVLTYTWAGNSASGNAYRVRPVNALGGGVPSFVAANPRPTAPASVGGTLRVAALNLLNYFNTFDGAGSSPPWACTLGIGGALTDCRGADDQAEFDRQWPKTVAAILGMNVDVLGVIEVENDGYGPTSAIADLVNRLNNASAPGTYAFIDADAATGGVNALGTDAIKVGLIYKPARVTPVGTTAALNSDAFVNGGDTGPRNRASLAQAFEQPNGARLIVNVNHFKSKGSACDAPDAGDGQGNCNAVRTEAANRLLSWLASDPTGTGDPDVLIVGDLNSYAKEDPITALINGGYTNLIESRLGPKAYSYVFDGQWGYLDYALSSASLNSQVTGVTEWHINADEPSVLDYNVNFKSPGQVTSLYGADQYRVSDHDPVIVGLNLNAPPTGSAGGPYSVDEGGSVAVSATGSDPNGDALIYAWDLSGDGSFETSGQSATFSAAALDGPGSVTIAVRATDAGGLSAVSRATVSILNVAPTVGSVAVTPSPSILGNPVTASASFSDPALNDAPFTCTVDYGDGSGAQAGTVSGGSCTGPAHSYTGVGSYTVTVRVTDKDAGSGANTAGHAVRFAFTGFFPPVANLPTVNVARAGSAIPVKFSLGGNQGLSIFESGYPKSQHISCDTSAPQEAVSTVTAGSSSLSYDAASDTYTYVWKTEKGWASTCRDLVVRLADETEHRARFSFTR